MVGISIYISVISIYMVAIQVAEKCWKLKSAL